MRRALPELLAPAGDATSLRAAIDAGADAIYFGVGDLNMRVKARNFTIDDLPDVARLCRERGVRSAIALNVILKDDDLPAADRLLGEAKDAGVDGAVVADVAAIERCRELDFPFTVSTQLSVSNARAARFYHALGAKRIVLARECSLEEIKLIRAETGVEIEVFAHGAMCVAVSGRCFLSHHVFGKSGNQGECYQPCRREYVITDAEREFSLELGRDYVLSPKDLRTVEFLDEIIDAGVDALKIEGRKRAPDYVRAVVGAYRRALDAYAEGRYDESLKAELIEALDRTYNRGFSRGFYGGAPSGADFVERPDNAAPVKKSYVGKVVDYYKKPKVASVRLYSRDVRRGETLLIMGPTTGVVEIAPAELRADDESVEMAPKGALVTFPCEKRVRENDKVYAVVENAAPEKPRGALATSEEATNG